ncbi:C25 family cysteine peptidase [Dyadobacter sp. Leaf189]|uniref:putative type IX secretion system sortase PorU2 n=1 Tax=Dyadobacter sp. Leaf189 TaxID=1736295 RepID=UPI0006F5DE19|nr:C25 family cysteine peptidase [Dyadobacter sp. Leaf189]KQS33226.1 hypothetical protein ASG33_03845 [Dyadobacter sp. Leaf189]
MNYRHTLYNISLLIFILTANLSFGQAGKSYDNSWIKYDQPYLKILVSAKGIHKVPLSALPASFPVSEQAKLQLWHYGKQVAISIINNEIIFYGVPNEGKRDSLLYRPYSARLNPYFSMYSDETAYFLTVSTSKSLRAETITRAVDMKVPATVSHIAKDPYILKTDYSLITPSPLRPHLSNSFFEDGASRTGPAVVKNTQVTYPVQLTNPIDVATNRPRLKMLIHGRSNNLRNVEVSIGKTAQDLRLVGKITSRDFVGSEFEFDILPGDLDQANKGVIALKSPSNEAYEAFSLGYFTVTYLQTLSAQSKKSYEFSLPASKESVSRLNISGLATGSVLYDITDTLKVISGDPANLMVPRKAGKELKLLATSEVVTVDAAKISTVDFKAYDRTKAEFIIITSENLLSSSQTYAAYRSSAAGGGRSVLVANIKDLYNQFNYGEPSPLGIRGFMDYILADGNKNRNLFLIGSATSYVDRMKRGIPDEVPTVGYPGSDLLLVSGIAGASIDNAAIPVGRLHSITNEQVLSYLDKVKEYEHSKAEDRGWQKQILHLSGGKSVSEITQLKNLLERERPAVENGRVGGKVIALTKQQAMAEVEKVNITPQVNAGVGMITFFGHGSSTITDPDIGYVSDVDRGYDNAGKYPLMYFNGCSVGNIFAGKTNTSPSAGNNRAPLSLDWMIAPKKGAIAVIANSYEGFISPLTGYLDELYAGIFSDEQTSNLSIGQIQLIANEKVLKAGANEYDIANIHQSVLQGDPTLKLVSVANADYALDADEAIFIRSEEKNKSIGNSANLTTGIIIENHGRYIKDQKVPVEVSYEYKDGTKRALSATVNAFASRDTLLVAVVNNKDLARIIVRIDPDSTISETSRKNNYSDLVIDWDRAKDQSFYPTEPLKDVVAPIMNVMIDGRTIRNGDYVSSNPSIEVVLEDDRLLSADSSLVDIFLKSCQDDSCEFIRLAHSSGIEIVENSERSLSFNYQFDNLIPGTYELLVSSKDGSGNASVKSYRILFVIPENVQRSALIASPNPASEYVRFALENVGQDVYDSITWKIYNLNGILVDSGSERAEKQVIKEWYWLPRQNVKSGIYIYQVKLSGNTEKSITGRIALTR